MSLSLHDENNYYSKEQVSHSYDKAFEVNGGSKLNVLTIITCAYSYSVHQRAVRHD